jgi:FkbM family methyltransferase
MSLSVEEIEAIGTVIPLLPQDAVIFDVGANAGTWTDMILENLPSARLHLFEPNKELLEQTKTKYVGNENIKFTDLAAFREDNKILNFYFFTNENNGLSSIYHNPQWDYLPMKVGIINSITIDTYCREREIESVDCIKIDVEGAELDVLQGCKELLGRKAIKYLQVEYSPHYKLNNRTFMDVVQFVKDFGYSAYFWQHGDFVKITEDNFVENYRLENFVLTFEALENVTQHWNTEFIKNTEFLKKKCDLVIEFGCFEGMTSKYICENLLTPEGRVTCIDPLKDVYLTEELSEEDVKMNNEYGFFKKQYFRFKKNTYGLPIALIRTTTRDAYKIIEDLRADLIYVDADHRENEVYHDGLIAFYLCKVGGYILFDDYTGYRDYTTKGVNRALAVFGNRIEVIHEGYQLLIKKLGNVEINGEIQ